MVTKFTKITNYLASLGDGIDNDQKVRKIIRTLPPCYNLEGAQRQGENGAHWSYWEP